MLKIIGNWKLPARQCQALAGGEIGNSRKGFTLIELIVVIAVLGIISVVSLSFIDPLAQMEKARDAQRKSDLSQIQKVLEQYYQDYGRYPLNTATYQIETSDASDPVKEWGFSWTPYMNILPKDPTNRTYVYVAGTNGQAYYLYASLERGTSDPQACSDIPCPSVPSDADCGGECNYGVSSPNVSP